MSRIVTTGQRFDRLIALAETRKGGNLAWLCLCDCGNEKVIAKSHLTHGLVKSCGCYRREFSKESAEANFAKGEKRNGVYPSQHPRFRAYKAMIHRCANPNVVGYANYGGRGIRVCERWLGDFWTYLDDIGAPPETGAQLDRINNDGNYEPGNVRWATRSEQARNRRSSLFLEVNGIRRTVAGWAAATGLNRKTIYWRLSKGASPEDAVST